MWRFAVLASDACGGMVRPPPIFFCRGLSSQPPTTVSWHLWHAPAPATMARAGLGIAHEGVVRACQHGSRRHEAAKAHGGGGAHRGAGAGVGRSVPTTKYFWHNYMSAGSWSA
jgi:hypothetical protein